jgi:hypothetical protein
LPTALPLKSNTLSIAQLRPPRCAHAERLGRNRYPSGLAGRVSILWWAQARARSKQRTRVAIPALSIADWANPYAQVQIRGRVAERRVVSDFGMRNEVSQQYTGTPLSFRTRCLVIAVEKARRSKLPSNPRRPKIKKARFRAAPLRLDRMHTQDFPTTSLLSTVNAPKTWFARIPAICLSPLLSTEPYSVTWPLSTMMRMGRPGSIAYLLNTGSR